MFGGNSNWRGPVWMPVNALIHSRACSSMYPFYGDDFKVECPDRFREIHDAVRSRQRDWPPPVEHLSPRRNGKRPVYGGTKKFQDDPHWRDYILFYEYFHGDNGAGLGASHQTGWTGLIARTLDLFARVRPEDSLRPLRQ